MKETFSRKGKISNPMTGDQTPNAWPDGLRKAYDSEEERFPREEERGGVRIGWKWGGETKTMWELISNHHLWVDHSALPSVPARKRRVHLPEGRKPRHSNNLKEGGRVTRSGRRGDSTKIVEKG